MPRIFPNNYNKYASVDPLRRNGIRRERKSEIVSDYASRPWLSTIITVKYFFLRGKWNFEPCVKSKVETLEQIIAKFSIVDYLGGQPRTKFGKKIHGVCWYR